MTRAGATGSHLAAAKREFSESSHRNISMENSAKLASPLEPYRTARNVSRSWSPVPRRWSGDQPGASLSGQLPPLWWDRDLSLQTRRISLPATSAAGQQQHPLTAVGRGLRARGPARGCLLRLRRRLPREAAFQGVHQVDDLGRIGDRTRRCRPSLRLRLDQLAPRVLIAVSEARRLERTRSAFNDRLGDSTILGSASPAGLAPNSAGRTFSSAI